MARPDHSVTRDADRAALEHALQQATSDNIVVCDARWDGDAGGQKALSDQLQCYPWLVTIADRAEPRYTAAGHAQNIRGAYYKARRRLRELLRTVEAQAYEGN